MTDTERIADLEKQVVNLRQALQVLSEIYFAEHGQPFFLTNPEKFDEAKDVIDELLRVY